MFKVGDRVKAVSYLRAGLTDSLGGILSEPIKKDDVYTVEALAGINNCGEQGVRLHGVGIRFRSAYFTYVDSLKSVKLLSLTLASHICPS